MIHKSFVTQFYPIYDPLKDPVYMSDDMIQYFKMKLIALRDQIRKKDRQIDAIPFTTIENTDDVKDIGDQSEKEELRHRNLVFNRHEAFVLSEITEALQRIDNGSYGYCDETGNIIGIKRLEAVPQARYCLSVQERLEKMNNTHSLGGKKLYSAATS